MTNGAPHSFLLGLLIAGGAVSAQDAVRLTRVPERVVLPAPSGSNLVLEVEVMGAAKRVWLARTERDLDGVPLTAAGNARYQLNLADARVLDLLRAGEASGSFRVNAGIGDATVASAPIAWSRGDAPVARVRCHVVGDGAEPVVLGSDGEHWLDLAQCTRLEIHGVGAPLAQAKLVAGTTDLPLPWLRDRRRFGLDLNDGVQKALQAAGRATIDVQCGDELVQFAFRVVPDRVGGELGEVFPVMQRQRAFVPGTRDWLEVRIDDITMGQVLLEVVDANGRPVVAARHVADRDDVPFALGGQRYVLFVDRLVNKLIAEDWAELSVRPAADFRPDLIARLIRRVDSAADVKFVREGQPYDADIAAQFLRARRLALRGPAPTPREFVEVASKSSRTGEPYHVQKADGTLVPARDWLLEQLAAVERDAAAGAKAGQRDR
ncbi:MAG: DUF5329 family protein [Planctomycetota bacterium]